ncbi:MAG TPA: hypothetical protein VKK79_12515 [Candidatus Lokiarchaeia archaeon]|nr:hypothetical protein [Candidatus Lokiarchaeia archaeon]
MSFRYLVPESLITDLFREVNDNLPGIINGWIWAERKENFAIVKGFQVIPSKTKVLEHIRPKSWMRRKKNKIFTMRKMKKDLNMDIVWEFHSHPDGNENLHDVDLKILNYLSTGVMVIATPTALVGWYYDKRESKKPIIEKMVFETIADQA